MDGEESMKRRLLLAMVLPAVWLVSGGIGSAPAVVDGVAGQTFGPPDPRERPDDPPSPHPARADATARSMPAGFAGAPYPSVQVNVDGQGLNIVGDAANEPSIAISPVDPDRVVIGWREFADVRSNFREAGWAYSADAGASWTFPGVLEDGVFRSDPVLDADGDGRIHYYSVSVPNDITGELFSSADDGVTWTGPVPAFGGDKPWMAVDRSEGPGRNNVYAFFRIGASTSIGFTRSFDRGVSFPGLFGVPDRPGRGTLAVGPESEVYLAGFSFISGDIVLTKTTNAWAEFEDPEFGPVVEIDLGGTFRHRDGPNPGGLLGQVWVAVDHSSKPTRGNVYVLCSMNPPGTDPLDVQIARSTDGGETWSAPVRVNDDAPTPNAWQWFGTVSVAPTGRLDVVWNDTRREQTANLSELYYAYSNDAGDTWSRNVVVTPVFDSWVGWPDQAKIGDYYDMISDAAAVNVAYAATFNGEQDVYFVRIGDCNANGVHDGTDLAEGTSQDINGNGIPDECECLGDIDGNRVVNLGDLVAVLAAWGPCDECPEDIDGNGTVDFVDVLAVLSAWGPCE